MFAPLHFKPVHYSAYTLLLGSGVGSCNVTTQAGSAKDLLLTACKVLSSYKVTEIVLRKLSITVSFSIRYTGIVWDS